MPLGPVGLVLANDRVGAASAALILNVDGCPKERLVPALLPRIDDHSRIEALGEEVGAPVDLPKPPFPINVLGVLGPVPLRCRFSHLVHRPWTLDRSQAKQLLRKPPRTLGRDVVGVRHLPALLSRRRASDPVRPRRATSEPRRAVVFRAKCV